LTRRLGADEPGDVGIVSPLLLQPEPALLSFCTKDVEYYDTEVGLVVVVACSGRLYGF
jgi:hypothetical protein